METNNTPLVLVLCTGNSCRSHLAEGILRNASGGAFRVASAGSKPAGYVHPLAIKAMAEIGIDITAAVPRKLDYELAESSDVVITMGCGDACPVFPGKRYEDWKVTDPAGQPIEVVRQVRDEIREQVRALLADLVPANG